MKIQVTVQAEIIVEFDEKSKKFQKLFEGYKQAICNSDYEEFADNIASQIARYGGNDYIEGVGFPKLNGEKHIDYFAKGGATEHDCPINVIADFDMNDKIDFEIYWTQKL